MGFWCARVFDTPQAREYARLAQLMLEFFERYFNVISSGHLLLYIDNSAGASSRLVCDCGRLSETVAVNNISAPQV